MIEVIALGKVEEIQAILEDQPAAHSGVALCIKDLLWDAVVGVDVPLDRTRPQKPPECVNADL